MAKPQKEPFIKNNTNTINTDLTNDLKFLVLEVSLLFKMVKDALEKLDTESVTKIVKRDSYIDNLKSRIETLSYEAIFQLKTKNKSLILNYRALIRVVRNLEMIADFLVQVAKQVEYIHDKELFKTFDLNPFYENIENQLDNIHLGFTEVDKKLAEEICESEEKLDLLYLKQFNYIQENIADKSKSADMMTLLFIVRYFERIGDCFLKIGESILNISIGDALNITHYQNLEAVVKDLSKKKEETHYDFKPFLFSRSGCKVGRLLLTREKSGTTIQQKLFYKQGDTVKIVEEIDGLKLWKKISPDTVPEIQWKSIEPTYSTLVVNYLKGDNLLNFLLNGSTTGDVLKMADALAKKLSKVWSNNLQKGKKESGLVKQIVKRKQAIINVHQDFFEEFTIDKNKKPISFGKILNQALKLEQKVQMPFKVFCHGDFNLDNVLFESKSDTIRFIDVHRSGYNDYAQELSVFIVSSLRIKIDDENIQKKIKVLNTALFEFGKKFAKDHNDTYFEARFAFGLFRSFVTSTRFLQDDEWYNKLRMNALTVIKALEHSKKDFKEFSFDIKSILN